MPHRPICAIAHLVGAGLETGEALDVRLGSPLPPVLLRFKDQPLADCGEVNSLLDEHIGHVAERIKALRALEKELRALRAACPVPHASADCGILQGIDHAGAKPAAASKRHVRGAH